MALAAHLLHREAGEDLPKGRWSPEIGYSFGRAFLLVLGLAGTAFAQPASKPAPEAPAYTWIFFGALPATLETFSGTLVASATRSEFELRLADGTPATAPGSTARPGSSDCTS